MQLRRTQHRRKREKTKIPRSRWDMVKRLHQDNGLLLHVVNEHFLLIHNILYLSLNNTVLKHS